MSLQDREWFIKGQQEKEEKYNGDFSLKSKPNFNEENEEKQSLQEEVNNTYGNGNFFGKVVAVKKQKGIYHVKCACGKCNGITDLTMKKQPQGTYNYECSFCKCKNVFKKYYFSTVDIVAAIIGLIALYYIFLR